MSRGPLPFKQAVLQRAIRAAKAELESFSLKILKDGSIVITAAHEASPAVDEDKTAYERWKEMAP